MEPELAANIQDLLTKGVAEAIETKSIEKKLRRRKPLRVKLGIDPTGHHLHLGHVVPLRKLRAWQAAGHTAVLIIGDYTARVGDPSGRDASRLALSAEQTARFAATYLDQAGRILDIQKTEVRYNSEWYDRFSASDFVKLLGRATVNQMLAHETFRKRLDAGLPLGIHELVYPLLQGYDSVMVKADIELGGLDQKFNLLAGRDLQQAHSQQPQDVLLMDYLLGTDGKQKMSKTAANFIALDDSPNEMFGKVMSIPDKAIGHYFELATDMPETEVEALRKQLRKKDANPRMVKAQLAHRIVTQYYGEYQAQAASEEFDAVFSKKKKPSAMPVMSIRPGPHPILNLLVSHQLAPSRSEARRLVEQGGVKVDDTIVEDWNASVIIRPGSVIQVGKRRFVRVG